MALPVDIGALPAPAQRLLEPKGPPPLRQMAAKGLAPGLKPGDALAVVVALAAGEDATLAAAATATLDALPAPLLKGALGSTLAPWVLDALAPRYAHDAAVMERLLAMPTMAPETVAAAAAAASEAVGELIATNEERLLAHPAIIEALYMNKAIRMSTADRVLELAVRNGLQLQGIAAFEEASQAIKGELIVEASDEPTPDDLEFREVEAIAVAIDAELAEGEEVHALDEATGEEVPSDKVLPLHARLAQMTISQRIRRAMLGTTAERMLLVRDTNKMVALAAIKSPMMQEGDVIRISTSRSVSDAVLVAIVRNKAWIGNHSVKFNLVSNPRLPFMYASRFVGHLRDDELKTLTKSKAIAANVAQLAKQTLLRRKK
jgi:hypothetical protein